MDPLEYLATLLSRIEQVSKLIEVEEEQTADWLIRSTAFEERLVVGLGAADRRAIEKRIRVCLKESERLGELLTEHKRELEELEEARAGLERAGVRL